MTLLKNFTFICLDCEFTGLDPEKDRIIEVAAIRFTLSEILETFESLINPDCPISEESIAIHHITATMLRDKPKMEEILPQLLAFLGRGPIVGHGIGHDMDMIMRAAERANIPGSLKSVPLIDSLRLARFYGDSPNNSLASLALHFNVSTEGAHRALNDVKTNIDVFKHLIQRFRTLEQIQEILSHPIKMKYMPLGKHKGRLFSEIPLQYLQWAASMNFDQDLLYSIRVELKKRKSGGGFSQMTNPFTNL